MPVGDKIRTVDYNSLQTKTANILGTGSASFGYGQTVQSSQVTTSDSVTVNEWGRLRNDVINIYRHQNNAIPTTVQLPETVDGASVRYNATDAPVIAWDTFLTTLETARVNALPVGRFGTSTGSSRGYTATFSNSAYFDVTYTWASAEEARFFFNGGGRLRLTSSFSGIGTSQNTAWASLLSTVGTREWGGFYPDTGVSGTDGRNWHKSDASLRQFFSQSATAPYGSNTYSLLASKSGATVTIRYQFVDNYTDPPTGDPDNPPPNDLVSGTLIGSAAYTYPSGALTGLGAATWTEYQPTLIGFSPSPTLS
jgi:hypothetical protein